MSNQPALWPFPIEEHILPSTINVESEKIEGISLKPYYSLPGTYKINIGGRGSELAIGSITQEQYDFWSHPDHEPYLGQALNNPDEYSYENSNNETVDIPEECHFQAYYNEYDDVAFIAGADFDSSWITILDPNGEKIYDNDFNEFITLINDLFYQEINFLDDGEVVEFDDCAPGNYVFWIQGGKGMYFEGDIEISPGSKFELNKLCFKIDDIEGNQVIGSVTYDGEYVENYGGDWSGKYDDYSVFNVGQN